LHNPSLTYEPAERAGNFYPVEGHGFLSVVKPDRSLTRSELIEIPPIECCGIRSDDEEQLLFMKSRYMAPDQEGYERQKTFDEALEKLHLLDFDLSQFGPPTSVFTAALASAGYSINGFTIAALSE